MPGITLITDGIEARRPARAGRPPRDVAAALSTRILDAATELFLRNGYAATTMEAIAATAGVSKRTLYKRAPNKEILLREAIGHVVSTYVPAFEAAVESENLEQALLGAARQMLAVALDPRTRDLYRLVVAESGRRPEIAQAAQYSGTALPIIRVAELLRRHTKLRDPVWAAEQFQRLIVTGPQARILGFGRPLRAAAAERWVRNSVALFLRGIAGLT